VQAKFADFKTAKQIVDHEVNNCSFNILQLMF